MSKTNTEPVNAKIYTKKRDYYHEDEYLFGLIKVYSLIKTDVLHNELRIIAPPTDKVYINGQEWFPPQPSSNRKKK